MMDQSMLDSTTVSTVASTNPHEIALQSLCKQLLKSRLFKGFYLERRYVEDINAYRDVVCLQKSERSLEKMLRDISDKLKLFYSYQNPRIWIGITSGPLTGISGPPPNALETYLWVELNDLAFIEYWFSIKSIRFRDNEIIIKLKVVQPVEQEDISKWSLSSTSLKAISDKKKTSTDSSNNQAQNISAIENQITLDDFLLLLQQWWSATKETVYNFMAHDITKDNIKGFLRFMGLLIVTLVSVTVVGLKYLGNFTLRLMFELSRLTHVLTPIIVKIIEMLNKIVGGFYILLAMIWRDTVVNRKPPKLNAIEYNPTTYKSIQYEAGQRKHVSTSFERNFQ